MWDLLEDSLMFGTGAGVFYLCFWLMYSLDEKREWRSKLIYPNLIIMALLANPLLCKYVWPKVLGYGLPRLNMCFPVGFIISYVLTSIWSKKRGKDFLGTATGIILILTLCYSSMIGDLKMPQNLYGLPQDVITTSDVLLDVQADPLLLMSDPDFNYFRQYDNNLHILYGENVTAYKMRGTLDNLPDDYFILSEYMESESIDWSLVCPIADKYKVNFIIINTTLHTVTSLDVTSEYQYWQTVGIYDIYRQQ